MIKLLRTAWMLCLLSTIVASCAFNGDSFAEPEPLEPLGWTTLTSTEPPQEEINSPVIISAACNIEASGELWAEVRFPGKSVPELSYVKVSGRSYKELSAPLAGYRHSRVTDIFFKEEHVLARCGREHDELIFVLSEDLDLG